MTDAGWGALASLGVAIIGGLSLALKAWADHHWPSSRKTDREIAQRASHGDPVVLALLARNAELEAHNDDLVAWIYEHKGPPPPPRRSV